VAVFDTAFHSTIPPSAYHYAIPYKLYEELGIRRYGMHGTSYQYLLDCASHILGKPQEDVNIIALHLGAGASMAAIKDGKCIDTSMGVTPLQGLVMSTRSGDIDPAIIQMLATEKGMNIDEITNMLNKKSGLLGLCGEKDMRSVWDAAEAGSARHKLALQVYVHRIRTYLGAYFFHLQGRVDALVFSAGVGEASGRTRALICEGLEKFGIEIDPSQNVEGKLKEAKAIHKKGSKVQILVIPSDEELSIARLTLQVVGAHQPIKR
jgi:acetate kinase